MIGRGVYLPRTAPWMWGVVLVIVGVIVVFVLLAASGWSPTGGGPGVSSSDEYMDCLIRNGYGAPYESQDDRDRNFAATDMCS